MALTRTLNDLDASSFKRKCQNTIKWATEVPACLPGFWLVARGEREISQQSGQWRRL